MNADAQMDAARDFPQNTCGASRHAQILAESMLSATAQRWSIDEPNHCGESIAATVTALYEARTELRRLAVENEALRAEAMRFRDDALNEQAARKAIESALAVMSGDVVAMLKAYKTLQAIEAEHHQ